MENLLIYLFGFPTNRLTKFKINFYFLILKFRQIKPEFCFFPNFVIWKLESLEFRFRKLQTS